MYSTIISTASTTQSYLCIKQTFHLALISLGTHYLEQNKDRFNFISKLYLLVLLILCFLLLYLFNALYEFVGLYVCLSFNRATKMQINVIFCTDIFESSESDISYFSVVIFKKERYWYLFFLRINVFWTYNLTWSIAWCIFVEYQCDYNYYVS